MSRATRRDLPTSLTAGVKVVNEKREEACSRMARQKPISVPEISLSFKATMKFVFCSLMGMIDQPFQGGAVLSQVSRNWGRVAELRAKVWKACKGMELIWGHISCREEEECKKQLCFSFRG